MRVQIKQLSAEVLKGQIVAATLRDVVRLLGFMGRDGSGDPMKIIPDVPEVRQVMARELHDLAKHLRGRADKIESYAVRIVEEVEEGSDGDEASQ